MSLVEIERRKAGHDQRQDDNADRVMSFKQWYELIGVSRSLGRRIITGPDGPRIVQLSKNRIGVRVADNHAWLESRSSPQYQNGQRVRGE